MVTVRIPQPMRVYTNDKDVVRSTGQNVRKLIDELEGSYPGIKAALVTDDKLRPDVAIMLDGKISRLGLLQPLSDENEVVFIPAISGG
ncbi:MAG: molybdopterin synthase sulfur carrier subunit [Gammaproteobacteria bacterium]|jgi:molybdopterin synthase sulfur carrier subunit